MTAPVNAVEIAAPAMSNPYTDRSSMEFGFRVRRFAQIQRLIETILAERGSCQIVDLGGTETYWLIGESFLRRHRSRLSITLVNTEAAEIDDSGLFTYVRASASNRELLPGDRFDLVHSNSLIEHVGWWADMNDFAANVRRLAPRYYVQTPNYWFPYEPHFRFPGFQYLPEAVRRALIMRFSLGFFKRVDDAAEARDIIDHHRLLSYRQMRLLFPDAHVGFEKVIGMNKSIIAVRADPAT